jgi:hypothetical protein
MLVRSSSYQSQYIFGKDFHLRRLQKVTTESFPPAGGIRKLIGHGIYVFIYIHCRLPRGKRIVWQNGFVLHRMGTVNSPRCGLLGNDLQDHIWIPGIPGIPGILVSSAVGSGERQRCGTTFRLETLVLSHVHLFVCVLCVFPHWCYHSQEVLTSHLCPLSCCSQEDWWGEIPRSFLHVMLTGCLSP